MIRPAPRASQVRVRDRARDINELIQVIAECGADHPARPLFLAQLQAARTERTALLDSLGQPQTTLTPTNIPFPIWRFA
ncbi:hypothetical protein D3875_03025 [Deinococcus cavernae]|uniref:Uncharacterized protein n=1 Tax=Deinococcus cavernae TaxID=2320857 RepID=A0A418VFS3_9DEIO|nr:hypothetical protein [Deinococcus cavernae]RJF74985.1 hypothetical protein D3875_03025 [Deinococcus cavernae]